MAHWDSENGIIVRHPPEEVAGYPEWEMQDCGCCNGLEWGGDEPIECRKCDGNGVIYHHKISGIDALYIGGPLIGRRRTTAST
jgi:hypothetical protein